MDKNFFQSTIGQVKRKVGENSIRFFADSYLTEYMKHKTSRAHDRIYKLLDDLYRHRGRRVAIAGFRGLGKTTLVTNFLVAHAICYGKEKNIAICSNTSEQAMDKIEDIRKMFIENASLRKDFAEVFGPKDKMPVWRKGEIITNNGIRIKAYGYKQGIRGSKHGADRPSLAIADDLDSDVNSNSLEQKDKLKEWFMGSFLRVGDQKTNFIVLGNIFHRYSVIGDLCTDDDHHEWEKCRIPILERFPDALELWEKCWAIECGREEFQGARGRGAAEAFYNANREAMDRGAVLTWPERDRIFPILMEFERDHETFNAEYQNIPRNPANNVFYGMMFIYWDQFYKNLLDIENYLAEGVYFLAPVIPQPVYRMETIRQLLS